MKPLSGLTYEARPFIKAAGAVRVEGKYLAESKFTPCSSFQSIEKSRPCSLCCVRENESICKISRAIAVNPRNKYNLQ